MIDTFVYQCGCDGYRLNDPTKFCLRCLEAWVSGLEGTFSGPRLHREMQKAASIFARRLSENPDLAAMKLNDALNASETSIV